MTHGDDALRAAQTATEALFGGDVSSLSADELLDVFHDVPSSDMPRERLEGEGVALTEMLTLTGLAASRGEARRLIQGNGIALGSRRETDPRRAVRLGDAVDGSCGRAAQGGRGSGGWCGWWGEVHSCVEKATERRTVCGFTGAI